MSSTKHWWASKTIIAGIVAILAVVAGRVGVVVSEDQQDELVRVITDAIVLIAGSAAIYGRKVAKSQIA